VVVGGTVDSLEEAVRTVCTKACETGEIA